LSVDSSWPPIPDARGCRRVLFVCLGNICRSPLAQGVFEHLIQGRGIHNQFTVASCGTGDWHIGQPPDPRTILVAERHGVKLHTRGRQLDAAMDFARFDLILGMDRRNLEGIRALGCPPQIAGLFLLYAASTVHPHLDVPDPYYGGPEGFDEMYRLILLGSEALLDAMLEVR